MALEPVALLWERLGRHGARRLVAEATRAELARLAGVLGTEHPAGAREAAERVLADRLYRRLLDEGGPNAVRDTVGWMKGRGLPTRGCEDRCDDGFRLDLNQPCEWCAARHRDRQHRRRTVITTVTEQMPHAAPDERWAEIEQRLKHQVAGEVAATALRHERAARERAEREAWAAEQAAVREAEAVARQAAERAQPCADCNAPDAGGLCAVCASNRATEQAVAQAGDIVAAAAWDGEDLDQALDAATDARLRLREQLATARDHAQADGALPEVAALMVRLAAETARDDHRTEALHVLAHSRQADETQRRACHKLTDLGAAAERAADDARTRTAAHLLATRTAALADARAHRAAEQQARTAAQPGPVAAGTCAGWDTEPCGAPVHRRVRRPARPLPHTTGHPAPLRPPVPGLQARRVKATARFGIGSTPTTRGKPVNLRRPCDRLWRIGLSEPLVITPGICEGDESLDKLPCSTATAWSVVEGNFGE